MRHSALTASGSADARLKGETQAVRDRLQHLLKTLDELVEPDPVSDPVAVGRIRAILKARRLRGRFFEAGLFADPAWDILLELYAAELGQYRVSVSSLCIAAAVPATTALRWIQALERKGLLVREADPYDGRRFFVALSPDAAKTMNRLFAAAPASEPLF